MPTIAHTRAFHHHSHHCITPTPSSSYGNFAATTTLMPCHHPTVTFTPTPVLPPLTLFLLYSHSFYTLFHHCNSFCFFCFASFVLPCLFHLPLLLPPLFFFIAVFLSPAIKRRVVLPFVVSDRVKLSIPSPLLCFHFMQVMISIFEWA